MRGAWDPSSNIMVTRLGAWAISDGGHGGPQAYETDEVALIRTGRTRGRHSGIQPLVKNGKLDTRGFKCRLFAPSRVVVGSMAAAPSPLGEIHSGTAIFQRLNAAHTRFHSLRTFCRTR